MKMDKDTLIKQKFWLILGAFTLVWLIGLILLLTSASSTIAKEKANGYDKGTNDSKDANFQNPKSPAYLPPWEKYGDKFKKHKAVVWKEAWQGDQKRDWEGQKGLVVWPNTREAAFQDVWDHATSFADWLKAVSAETEEKGKFSSTQARSDFQETLYLQLFTGPWKAELELDKSERDKDGKEKLTKEKVLIKGTGLQTMVSPIEFKGGTRGFDSIMSPRNPPGSGANRSIQPGVPAGVGPNPQAQTGDRTIRNFFKEKRPTVEECWLAMEDYWVKKELLTVLRTALDNVARFKESKPKDDEKLPEGCFKHAIFRNSSWRLDLYFEEDKGKIYISPNSTLMNIDESKRVLNVAKGTKAGLEFRLTQMEKNIIKDYVLRVKGEPLPWTGYTTFNERFQVDNIDPKLPFGVEQIFDWSTSPIKRIDEIRLGVHSHRTAKNTLKVNTAFPEAKAGPRPQQGQQPDMGKMGQPDMSKMGGQPDMSKMGGQPDMSKMGGQPDMSKMGGQPDMSKMAGGRPGGQQAAPPASSMTANNGMERHRYLHITDTCRHLPFGMVLILDQNHLHDVLTALHDSKMRVQITQLHFHHVRGITQESEDKKDDRTPPVTPMGVFPFPPQAGLADGDQNLVELTIYGVAALYERFPAEKKQETPPAPKQP
jgi:hypothetical protein